MYIIASATAKLAFCFIFSKALCKSVYICSMSVIPHRRCYNLLLLILMFEPMSVSLNILQSLKHAIINKVYLSFCFSFLSPNLCVIDR
uniref:Uncharacterized protein n=1 Tax=Solanum lycopersicum TaxID=4081 RepID=A0A3Q7GLL8_SOLLC